MVHGSYLRVLIAVFYAFIELPSATSAPELGTICDRITYGLPLYQACRAVLLGSAASPRGGISHIDSFEHGFLLPYFGKKAQFTDWQWRHRFTLPLVWGNQLCKVALFVNINPNGEFTTDSGSWSDIAQRGEYVADTCLVDHVIGGGSGRAGALGKLTITIFAPGSYFDRVITSGIGGGELVAFNASRSVENGSAEMTLVNLTQEDRGQGYQISNSSPSNLSLSYY